MSILAEIRCPLVLAVPNQSHRLTYSHNDEQIILCSMEGSHKFKPKSQYKRDLIYYNKDCPCFGIHSTCAHFVKLNKIDLIYCRIDSAIFFTL